MEKAILSIKPLSFPWETKKPFLFCVHHEDHYPAGNDDLGPATSLGGRMIGQDFTIKDGFRMYHGRKVPGFPAHPHRGFETVTIVRKGFVDHSDSLGAAGRFGNGDVQWLTTGKGVQHSEMFPLLNKEKDNPFELFQIWLNLPASKKMAEPHYAMLWDDEIPVVEIPDKEDHITKAHLVAGEIKGQKAPDPAPDSWAADPENNVAIWTIEMEPGAEWAIPTTAKEVNRTLYFFVGNHVEVNGEDIPHYHAVELKPDEPVTVKNNCEESAEFLVLQGKPIDEPVVQHGPFVMNNHTEIQDTIYDYQMSQFGGWPWPSAENVHPRESGRFAKFADGSVVKKD